MKLSGRDVRRLREAICAVYTINDLKVLLYEQLELELDVVVAQGQAADKRIFDLLMYFQNHGRLDEFLTAVSAGRPKHQQFLGVLAAFVPELRADKPGGRAGSTPVMLIDASLDPHDSPYEQVTEGGKKVIRPKPTAE